MRSFGMHTRFSIFLLILFSIASSTYGRLIVRAQLVFPPTNGPCRQNIGLEPLQCTAPECIDVAAPGVCHIQTQEGMSGVFS